MPTLSLPEYDIILGAIGSQHLEWLAQQEYAGLAVLVDTETYRHCWPRLQTLLAPWNPVVIKVPNGEHYKNLATCQDIWQALFAVAANRRWCLLNLGGGVIGDMGGFCASTFKRGIDFIQLPTTLLSQVDASVGGKLGIDFNDVKNSIGLFQDPRAVWIDAAFLRTLPPREIRSGFAEIIKHALIADREQWSRLHAISRLPGVDWEDWLCASVAIKQRIVAQDPYERGLRKALNFGHTIGHAVESWFLQSSEPLLHGEAIAIGMICESWLAHQQTGLAATDLAEISEYLLRHYGYQRLPLEQFAALLALMQQDKKNETAAINFTLLAAPGRAVVNQTATADDIRASMEYYNALR